MADKENKDLRVGSETDKWKIKEANAAYTGGGIWCFWGALLNEEYFLASDDGWALILDASPEDFEESLYAEWQAEHLIAELNEGEDLIRFHTDLLDVLKGYEANDSRRGGIFDEEIEDYRNAWQPEAAEEAKVLEYRISRDKDSVYVTCGSETEVTELSELGPVMRSLFIAYTNPKANCSITAEDYIEEEEN